jgi:5,10-methenyltetrahydrofolate synthetase
MFFYSPHEGKPKSSCHYWSVTTPKDISEAKKELRTRVAQRRAQLRTGATDVRASAVALNGAEMVRHKVEAGSTIALFSSFGNEPPTDLLITQLVDLGYRVILPRVINDTDMTWHRYDGQWTVDTLGIPSPGVESTPSDPVDIHAADIIFIPAVAASQDGRRLGRGGGYYDRLLAQVPRHMYGGPIRIAVIDMAGLLPDGEIPMDEHDAYVDAVLVG